MVQYSTAKYSAVQCSADPRPQIETNMKFYFQYRDLIKALILINKKKLILKEVQLNTGS